MTNGFQSWLMTFVKSVTGGLKGPLSAAAFTFLAAIPCAMMMPVIDRDEARFVQATSQMLESKNFVDINYQDTPRHKKPVGIYWLQAASVMTTSTLEARAILSYRWPSILGAALAAFACAWGASRMFGARVGYKAGFLFGISFLLATEAFIAKTDAVLCGLTTLMMAALAQIYLSTRNLSPEAVRPKLLQEKLIFWVTLGLGILVKGLSPLIVLTTLIGLWIMDRRIGWARHLGWGWGLLIVALIVGPWAVMITITTDGAFWGASVGQDLGQKVVSSAEGHKGIFGYHTLLLPLTLFPVSWLLGSALQTALLRHKEAGVRFAIAWFLPFLLVFEVFPTKLPHYVLPAFGGLIWLCAASLDLPTKIWARLINWIMGLIGGCLLLVLAYMGYRDFGTPVLWPYVIVVGISAILMAIIGGGLLDRRHERAGLVFLVGAGVVAHLSFISLAASLTPLWVSQSMAKAMEKADLDPRQGEILGPVAVLGYAEPSFVFLMGTKTQLLNEDAKGAVNALIEGRPVFVDSRYEQAFAREAKFMEVSAHKVTTVEGVNYNRGKNKDVVLTLYVVEKDVASRTEP